MLRLCCAAARTPMLRASGARAPVGLRHASSGGGGGGAVKVNACVCDMSLGVELLFCSIVLSKHLLSNIKL